MKKIKQSDAEDVQKVTANLPKQILQDAMDATQKGITDTLIEGLQLLKRSRAYQKAMGMRGKLKLSLDLDESRERE